MLHLRIEESVDQDAKLIWIVDRCGPGETYLIEPIELRRRKLEPFERYSPQTATLTLTMERHLDQGDPLQQIADSLYSQGYLPQDLPRQEEMAAIRYHLEDMRALVFKGGKPERKGPSTLVQASGVAAMINYVIALFLGVGLTELVAGISMLPAPFAHMLRGVLAFAIGIVLIEVSADDKEEP